MTSGSAIRQLSIKQAKFILLQFNGIDEVFCRDGGATPYNAQELTLYMQRVAISLGRLRPDTQYDYKFVGLSHNTLRGAAGGAVLLAELLCAEGYMDRK